MGARADAVFAVAREEDDRPGALQVCYEPCHPV
jgi:hypothetical protein